MRFRRQRSSIGSLNREGRARLLAAFDTRYLIVTHNAVAMSRMDRLYGVTMVEIGISRIFPADLGFAEELAAAE